MIVQAYILVCAVGLGRYIPFDDDDDDHVDDETMYD
jgi:hypothetical protein